MQGRDLSRPWKYDSVGAALCGRPDFVTNEVDCLPRDDSIFNYEQPALFVISRAIVCGKRNPDS
jgi:hypothetical protein